MTPTTEKTKQHNAEAGWRRGYAADCKAPLASQEINDIAETSYQDIPGTQGESDNRQSKPKSTLSRFMQDRHKRAARMLGFALVLDDAPNWNAASAVWAARLTTGERAALAVAALHSLEPDEAAVVVEQVLGGAGYPLPPFLDPLSDAQWWADLANPAERRAYCLAAFMAMSKREQHDFLDFAKEAVA